MKRDKYFIISLLLVVFYATLSFAQKEEKKLPVSFSEINLRPLEKIEELKPFSEKYIKEQNDIAQRNNKAICGYVKDISLHTLTNSGQWDTLIDGSRLWRFAMFCDNESIVDVVFDKFWLPNGAKLYQYSYNRQKYSNPLSSRHNRGGTQKSAARKITESIFADTIVLEYYIPYYVKDTVGVIEFARIHVILKESIKSDSSFTGFNKSEKKCNVNINCESGKNLQDEKRSISKILIKDNCDNLYFGTGFLVNNTAQDFKPYFLTANHNLNGEDAVTANDVYLDWEFYWNYEFSGCEDEIAEPQYQKTNGAILLANNTYSDFALLKLDEDPQYINGINPYYLGWNVNQTNASTLSCIHHPKGDIKKISTFYDTMNNNIVSLGTYSSMCWNVFFKDGTTEGGSSGTPLLDGNGRVVGQLAGHKNDTTKNICDIKERYFGIFTYSWLGGSTLNTDSRRHLYSWLDPLNSGQTILDGINLPSDLYIRDDVSDVGDVPSVCDNNVYWNSPDIWIEEYGLPGAIVNTLQENTTYDICIRVHNKKSVPSENEFLLVYWAKAGLGLYWPYSWSGEHKVFCNNTGEYIPIGDVVSDHYGNTSGYIPTFYGSDTVIRVAWYTPSVSDYAECLNLTSDNWEMFHYCITALILDNDLILSDTNVDMLKITSLNNSVAWKNLTIVNNSNKKAIVSMSNPFNIPHDFRLTFKTLRNKYGESLGQHANVYLTLNADLLNTFNANTVITGLIRVAPNKFLVNDYEANINGLSLYPNILYTIGTEIEFNDKPTVIAIDTFDFDLVEYCNDCHELELVGGEHYSVVKNVNTEDVPVVTSSFGLNNIQNSSFISTIYPNPATNEVTIKYTLPENVESAYIKMLNTNGKETYTLYISSYTDHITINTDNFIAGIYNVSICVLNQVLDSKTLIIQ